MRRTALMVMVLGALLVALAPVSGAQPAMTPPAMVPAMAPVMAPAMRATVRPVAMAPVMASAMTVPAMALAPASVPVAPAMAPEAVPAPATAPAAPGGQPAVSAAPSQPKESGLDKADKWIGLIVKILLGLLAIVGAILGAVKGQDWRAKLKTERWQKILGYVDKAFPVVESLAKGTAWKGDDKLVEFLKRVNDFLKGEGEQELSAEEMALVKREAADKAGTLKTDNGQANKVDAKAVTRNG